MRPALSKGTKKGTLSKNNRSLKGALEGCLINMQSGQEPAIGPNSKIQL